MRQSTWLLGAAIPALLIALLLAKGPYQLPPREALDEHPRWKEWTVFSVQVQENDTATLRLRHPDKAHLVAVLHYRLMSATIKEEP